MTTNIFDGTAHVMATDSRWSVKHGDFMLYIDDVGYDKIELCNGKALMFAGYGRKIDEWKKWIRSNPQDASNMPGFEGMAVCMVDVASKAVDFSAEQDIVNSGAYCAGSGSFYAFSCWSVNRCAKKAVETAKSTDIFSGGEVKYYAFTNGENNLNYPQAQVTIEMVDKALSERGLVMNMNRNATGTPAIPFPKAAAANEQDAAVKDIRAKVASGDLSANAPCDGMYNDWKDEDKSKFVDALGRMFGWKK